MLLAAASCCDYAKSWRRIVPSSCSIGMPLPSLRLSVSAVLLGPPGDSCGRACDCAAEGSWRWPGGGGWKVVVVALAVTTERAHGDLVEGRVVLALLNKRRGSCCMRSQLLCLVDGDEDAVVVEVALAVVAE